MPDPSGFRWRNQRQLPDPRGGTSYKSDGGKMTCQAKSDT